MCDVPECNIKECDYLFYGRKICERCWDENLDLKKVLKIKEKEPEYQERDY